MSEKLIKNIIEPVQSALRHAKASIDIAEGEKEEWDIREIERRGALHNLEELAVAVRQAVDQVEHLTTVPTQPVFVVLNSLRARMERGGFWMKEKEAIAAAARIQSGIDTREVLDKDMLLVSLMGTGTVALKLMMDYNKWKKADTHAEFLHLCGQFNTPVKTARPIEDVYPVPARLSLAGALEYMLCNGPWLDLGYDQGAEAISFLMRRVGMKFNYVGEVEVVILEKGVDLFTANSVIQKILPNTVLVGMHDADKTGQPNFEDFVWVDKRTSGLDQLRKLEEQSPKFAAQLKMWAGEIEGRTCSHAKRSKTLNVMLERLMEEDENNAPEVFKLAEQVVSFANKQGGRYYAFQQPNSFGRIVDVLCMILHGAGSLSYQQGTELCETILKTCTRKQGDACRCSCTTQCHKQGLAPGYFCAKASETELMTVGLETQLFSAKETIINQARKLSSYAETIEDQNIEIADIRKRAEVGCAGSPPSGKHDHIDELAALLHVARTQRDDLEKQMKSVTAEAQAHADQAQLMGGRIVELQFQFENVMAKAQSACGYPTKSSEQNDWVDELIGLFDAAKQIKVEDRERIASLTAEVIKTRERCDHGDVGRLMNNVTELEQEIAKIQRKARQSCGYESKFGDGDWVDELMDRRCDDLRKIEQQDKDLAKVRELRDKQVTQLENLLVTANGSIDSLRKECEALKEAALVFGSGDKRRSPWTQSFGAMAAKTAIRKTEQWKKALRSVSHVQVLSLLIWEVQRQICELGLPDSILEGLLISKDKLVLELKQLFPKDWETVNMLKSVLPPMQMPPDCPDELSEVLYDRIDGRAAIIAPEVVEMCEWAFAQGLKADITNHKLVDIVLGVLDYGCVCSDHDPKDPPHLCPACLALKKFEGMARPEDLKALDASKAQLFDTIERIIFQQPIPGFIQKVQKLRETYHQTGKGGYIYTLDGKDHIHKGVTLTIRELRDIHKLGPLFNVRAANKYLPLHEPKQFSPQPDDFSVHLGNGLWEFTTAVRGAAHTYRFNGKEFTEESDLITCMRLRKIHRIGDFDIFVTNKDLPAYRAWEPISNTFTADLSQGSWEFTTRIRPDLDDRPPQPDRRHGRPKTPPRPPRNRKVKKGKR